MNGFRWCFVGGGLLFLGLLFSGSGTVQGHEAALSLNADAKQDTTLLLVPNWSTTQQSYGGTKISGVVINNTGRDLTYVEIDFAGADASGAQVETVMDNTTNLPAGQRWAFEATCLRGDRA